MTEQRELDRLMTAFFLDGTNELPDRVIDAALDEIDHTRQRRRWLPRKLSQMATPFRQAAAALIGGLAEPRAKAAGSPPRSGSIRPGARNVLLHRTVAAGVALALVVGGAWMLSRAAAPPRDTVAAPAPTVVATTRPTFSPSPSAGDPATVQIAEDFMRPFEYAIPAGSGLRPTAISRTMYGWIDGAQPEPSGLVQGPAPLGQDTSGSEVNGIVVGALDAAWSHGPKGRYFVRTTVAGFLADLDVQSGLTMGDIGDTTLDGHRASTVDLEPPYQNDIHVSGPITGLSHEYVRLGAPARLIAAEIDDVTVFVLLWGNNESAFNAWLPSAIEFVDSIHFHPAV